MRTGRGGRSSSGTSNTARSRAAASGRYRTRATSPSPATVNVTRRVSDRYSPAYGASSAADRSSGSGSRSTTPAYASSAHRTSSWWSAPPDAELLSTAIANPRSGTSRNDDTCPLVLPPCPTRRTPSTVCRSHETPTSWPGEPPARANVGRRISSSVSRASGPSPSPRWKRA